MTRTARSLAIACLAISMAPLAGLPPASAATGARPKILTTAQAVAATGYTGTLTTFDSGCNRETPPWCGIIWNGPNVAPEAKPLAPQLSAVIAYPTAKAAKTALALKARVSPGWGPDQILSVTPREVIRMQVLPLKPSPGQGASNIVELYTLKGPYLLQANCQPAGSSINGKDAALACARQLMAAQRALLP